MVAAVDAELLLRAGDRAGSWWLNGIGRLAEGATLAQARDDLGLAHSTLVEEFGSSREIATPRIQPLVERYMGETRPMMLAMLVAVGILPVITCANVGGLLLARGSSRHREISIRLALGAGRRRVVRQLLTESTVLAIVGGALGLLLGRLAVPLVVGLIPEQSIGWLRFDFDLRVFAFAFAISLGSVLVFGLAPALSASTAAPHAALQEAGVRSTAGQRRKRALGGLVIAEIALAVVLLVGAGLMMQVARTLQSADPGFRDDVLTFSVSLPDTAYADNDAQLQFFDGVTDRLAAVSGVTRADLTSSAPLGAHNGYFFDVPDTILQEDDSPVVLVRFVSPGYLETMGIVLTAGRGLDDADTLATAAAEPAGNDEPRRSVAIVNETFARTHWGTTAVLGREIRTAGCAFTIVGVNQDTKHYGIDRDMRPGVFLPHWVDIGGRASMTVALRGVAEESSYVGLARDIVREFDAEVPLYGIGTMREEVHRSMWSRRLTTTLIGTFATAALVLALAGIHSTISYGVIRRRREIGIRLALGAGQRQVVRQVLRDGPKLAAIGLACGLPLALAAGRGISALLFGVSAGDPLTYAVVVVLLVVATTLATTLPARHAARTDPAIALRAD